MIHLQAELVTDTCESTWPSGSKAPVRHPESDIVWLSTPRYLVPMYNAAAFETGDMQRRIEVVVTP